jgi:hypothetical protein
MTVLEGHTESRNVYKNFDLQNLNSNNLDNSHYMYQKYLQYNKFLPAGETKYFDHIMYNNVPDAPVTTEGKGLFNLFPLDLNSPLFQPKSNKNTGSTTLGVISTSPLKLEIELAPIPAGVATDVNWFLMYTFVYLNKINFPGGVNKKQDVTYDYVL